MTQAELVNLAKQIASQQLLKPEIICGICERESSWNPWEIRYEPDFRIRYVAPLELTPTQEIARSVSWGLMQVMGECAREVGYVKDLPMLCDPPTGILVGCQWFTKKLQQAAGDYTKALGLWNGGSNLRYPTDVIMMSAKYQ